MNRIQTSLLIGISALLLLGAGCAALRPAPSLNANADQQTNVNLPISAGLPAGEQLPISQFPDRKTYESADLGISIKYLADWTVTSTNGVLVFQPQEPPSYEISHGSPVRSSFTIGRYTPQNGETAESILRDKELGRDMNPGYFSLLEVGTVKVGSYQYLKRTLGGEGTGVQEYWIIHKGRDYFFSIFNSAYSPMCSQNDVCLAMLQSVKFTDGR